MDISPISSTEHGNIPISSSEHGDIPNSAIRTWASASLLKMLEDVANFLDSNDPWSCAKDEAATVDAVSDRDTSECTACLAVESIMSEIIPILEV